MNKQNKLEFINSIPMKLAFTEHRGCEVDWFYTHMIAIKIISQSLETLNILK